MIDRDESKPRPPRQHSSTQISILNLMNERVSAKHTALHKVAYTDAQQEKLQHYIFHAQHNTLKRLDGNGYTTAFGSH